MNLKKFMNLEWGIILISILGASIVYALFSLLTATFLFSFTRVFFGSLVLFIIFILIPKIKKEWVALGLAGFFEPIINNLYAGVMGGENLLRVYPLAFIDSVIISLLLMGLFFVVSKIWKKV